VTTNGVSVRRALSVAAIGAIDLALLARTGTFSTSYRLAVAAGAVMFGLATFTFFGRRPFHRLIIAAPRAVRGVIAVAPWTVLVVIILTTDPWWSQQYIAAKLLAAYAMTAWSSAWCAGADRESGAVSGLLAGLAALFFLAGLDGILFGLTRFGVVAGHAQQSRGSDGEHADRGCDRRGRHPRAAPGRNVAGGRQSGVRQAVPQHHAAAVVVPQPPDAAR
jgi:hypothetical protein